LNRPDNPSQSALLTGWRWRLALLGLFFFVFYIYIVYISASYNFDGVVYSQFLRYALLKNDLISILAPHHLLYYPLAFGSFKVLSILGASPLVEYYHLQLLSLFSGLLTLVFIYYILKALAIDKFFRLAGLFLIAFSYLSWFLSVEVEVHMPGFCCLVAGIYLLFFRSLECKHIFVAALCFSLAAGFHLSNGAIVLSLLLFFLYRRIRFKKILQFYSFYAFFLLLPYAWLTLVSRIDLVAWVKDILQGRSIFTGYAYAGTKFSRMRSLSVDSFRQSLDAVKEGILVSSTSVSAVLSLVLCLVILAVIVWQARKAVAREKLLIFIFWLLPFFVFFTFWQPGNVEFKLNVTVPLLIAFTYSWGLWPRQKIARPVFAFLAVAVFLVNFLTFFKPAHDPGNNPQFLVSQAIGKKTPGQATIVIAGAGQGSYLHGKVYIPYFSLRDVLILDWRLGKGAGFKEITREIKAKMAAGQAVYFLSELGSLTGTVKDLLLFHQKKEADYRHFLGGIVFGDKIDLASGYSLLPVLHID